MRYAWLHDKDIEFYDRLTLGYQIIFLVPRRGDYWTLCAIIEYRYGSRHSYLARDEAEAGEKVLMYCMTAADDHWSRVQTRPDTRIYSSGRMIRDTRLVSRRR